MRIFGKVKQIITRSKALKEAKAFLGAYNVYSPALQMAFDPVYSSDHLKYCAEENKTGLNNWKLCYVTNTSLWQVRLNNPTFFAQASVWDTHPAWIDSEPQAGYRLLDFKLTRYEKIEERKQVLGRDNITCSPAKIVTVAQAMIAMKKRKVPNQYLTASSHCCEGPDPTESFPLITMVPEGLLVYTMPMSIHGMSMISDLPQFGVIFCIEPSLGFPT